MNLSQAVPDSWRVGLQVTKRAVLCPVYLGTQYHCTVCGGDFRKFLTAGTPRRPNAECPRCGARERHRLMMHFLAEGTDLGRRDGPVRRILHLAPERMISKRLLRFENVDYLSGDINPTRAMVAVDVTDLHFEDQSFDVIICSHVLEHVRDDRAAIRELRRVLKDDGWALIDAPVREDLDNTYEDWTITGPEERYLAFGQWDHVRWYGKNYVDVLRGAGFDVELDPLRISPEIARRYGLNDKEHIYYCTRVTD